MTCANTSNWFWLWVISTLIWWAIFLVMFFSEKSQQKTIATNQETIRYQAELITKLRGY